MSNSGWTKAVENHFYVDSNSRRGLAVYYKIAGASEPTSITTSWTHNDESTLIVQELALTGGGTFTFDTSTSNNSGENNVTSISTGTTAESAQADSLVITAYMNRGVYEDVTWTNGVGDNLRYDSLGVIAQTGFKVDSAQSTKESTASWTTGAHATAAIAVFSVTSSGGGPSQADGQFGKGLDFDGNGDYVNIPYDATLPYGSQARTVSMWIYTIASSWADNDNTPFSYGDDATRRAFGIDMNSYDDVEFWTWEDDIIASTAAAETGWLYLTLTYDGSTSLVAYANGGQVGSTTLGGSLDTATSDIVIGGETLVETETGFFDSRIDEVRVSSIPREACWIETEYNNQSSPGTFYTMGAEEATPATAISLLSFTAKGQGRAVLVSWETAQEVANMGFNVYRAESAAGPFTKLNDELIPAMSFSVRGKAYSYTDSDVTPGKLYYYKLEDIDAFGKKTLHGPICVDWDGDGIPDDWEIAHGLDPRVHDGWSDLDGDGLTNQQEYKRDTDPLNPDTDGDGILDGDEDGKMARDDMGESRTLSNGVQIISADENGVTLELLTEGFDMELVEVGGTTYERLHIPEYIHGLTQAVGKPELAVKGILLDLPDGASPTLSVDTTVSEIYPGYRVYPVPEEVVQGDGGAAHVGEVFSIDEAAYATDGFYPANVAALGEIYTFRDQQKLQVLFHPLAFNPVSQELAHYTRIRVRVDYGVVQARNLSRAVSSPVPSPSVPRTVSRAVTWSPPVSQGPVYKVLVSEEGIYRMSGTWLGNHGVDVANMALDEVRLYNLGQELAIHIDDEDGDNRLDGSDSIEFYGIPVSGERAKYATHNVYWLTTFSVSGALRMGTMDGAPGAALLADSHNAAVRHEQDQYYVALAPGEDSRDRWFFQTYVLGPGYPAAWGGGQWTPFTVSLSGVAGSGTLRVLLTAVTDMDHEVEVSVNGSIPETYLWSGMADHEVVLDHITFVEGNNTVSLKCNSGDSENPDGILVDRFEAAYSRDFAASNEMLKFTHTAGSRYRITDFADNNLTAFDITVAGDVRRIQNFDIENTGPYALHMEPQGGSGERIYLVLSSAAVKTPAGISEDTGSTLASTANGADYILITHRDLGWDGNGDTRTWLDDLVALREGQGSRVAVADVENIFDEFSYGIETPGAVKDFLTYAYNSWTKPAPQYVLLVGHRHHSPRQTNHLRPSPPCGPYRPDTWECRCTRSHPGSCCSSDHWCCPPPGVRTEVPAWSSCCRHRSGSP
jgi:hypothetical protein